MSKKSIALFVSSFGLSLASLMWVGSANASPKAYGAPKTLATQRAYVAPRTPATTTSTSTTTSTDDAAKPEPDSVYRSGGAFGGTRVGPTVGVGAPEGIRLGLNLKMASGLVSAGGAFATVPTIAVPGASEQNGTATRMSGEAFLRLHPFRGAFFVGVAGGYASTTAHGTTTIQGYDADITAHIRQLYVAPHLGFQWMLRSGLTLGFDAGVELPLPGAGQSTPTVDATNKYGTATFDPRTVPLTGAAQTAMNVATGPIPVVHLLEVGFLL